MIRLEQEPLRTHTTFRIGGPAAYYFIPEREEEIIEALDFAKEKGLSYYVIGKGSNMLFSRSQPVTAERSPWATPPYTSNSCSILWSIWAP